jgi:hypothetical protein
MQESDWPDFLEAKPGKPKWKSDLEPIDMAILMFGAENCTPLAPDDAEDDVARAIMAEREEPQRLSRKKELRLLVRQHELDWRRSQPADPYLWAEDPPW